MRKKKYRIIEKLRQIYPDVQWEFLRDGRGSAWGNSEGRVVRAYSKLSPKYDGDDESCEIVYMWEDTQDYVMGVGGWGRLR